MPIDATRRGIGGAVLGLGVAAATETSAQPARRPRVAALIHDDMVLMDLVGPLTAFNVAGAEVVLVARDLRPVRSDVGISVAPAATFTDAPDAPDVLFVPGGLRGSVDAMRDAATRDWLRAVGERAGHVTSVCTGGLVLGAAGLLRGHRATAHWYVRDLLALFGAEPVEARVVTDRNRVTGGGVTAGLDFGLSIVAALRGEEAARRVQLLLEYDPQPPFAAGSPAGAGPTLTAEVLRARATILAEARAVAESLRT